MAMKMIRLKGKTKFKQTSFLLDGEYGFYIEDYFNERLCFERQRSERSKRPFMLMLLEIKGFSGKEKKELMKKVAMVLSSSTRDTDLRGWYQYDHIVGVLFTEVSDIERDLIKNKIDRSLCDELESEQVSRIEISFHVFPEDSSKGPSLDNRNENSRDNRVLYPDLTRPKLSKNFYFFMKRMIDILGSIACLIFFFPFFIIIPIMIKLTSKGPIIYKQERVGLYGKKFVFFKFRSMYVNNDPSVHREFVNNLINGQKGKDAEGGVYKIKNDSRITPFGKFLRKSSLDELPQLLNILNGDMSLVGPRPPIPYEVEKYEIWHRRRVLEVKPGLSGLWQVKGRSIATFDEMVRLDLKYSEEQSLWLDLKILLQTPWAVLKAKGAY